MKELLEEEAANVSRATMGRWWCVGGAGSSRRGAGHHGQAGVGCRRRPALQLRRVNLLVLLLRRAHPALTPGTWACLQKPSVEEVIEEERAKVDAKTQINNEACGRGKGERRPAGCMWLGVHAWPEPLTCRLLSLAPQPCKL